MAYVVWQFFRDITTWITTQKFQSYHKTDLKCSNLSAGNTVFCFSPYNEYFSGNQV